ncbi:MAG: hypothetical protein ABJB55_00370 [Actinomycetota bacterium]
MKIKGTCKRCGRDVFAEQIIAAGGACPWDGEPFNPDYAVVLVGALREAERAGTRLEAALEEIAALRPAFTIDASSVTGKLQTPIAELSKNLIAQG